MGLRAQQDDVEVLRLEPELMEGIEVDGRELVAGQDQDDALRLDEGGIAQVHRDTASHRPRSDVTLGSGKANQAPEMHGRPGLCR